MGKKLIIAIDGPAGSGKSTTARALAQQLGYLYIDTGAMYRALALAFLREHFPIDEAHAHQILQKYTVRLAMVNGEQRTFLNDEDVSEAIRRPEVTKIVSPVSALPSIRSAMVELQRALGKEGGVVLDGRDIGTNVFPDADVKIFLTASVEARARRRAAELERKGIPVDIEQLKQEIAERDYLDSHRPIAPLRKAPDAVVIDTTNLSFEEQVERIYQIVQEHLRHHCKTTE